MATGDLMSRALAALDEVDGPMSVEVIHRLVDAGGHRSYDAQAVRRLVFLTRMRLSGMAMRDLQHYVRLADEGDDTVPERLDLLLEHRDTIRRQLKELTLSLAATEYKIATYGGRTGPSSDGKV